MDFLRHYQLELTLAALVLALLELVIVVGVQSRLSRQSRMLRRLFSGSEGANLEELLRRCLDESSRALAHGDELESKLDNLTKTVRGCVQHCGLVRYDAYGDVSGQQSFSLALLDAGQNGAVVSGLFSRSESRCYGKAVVSGQAEQALTEEEQRALDLALGETVSESSATSTPSPRHRLRRRHG